MKFFDLEPGELKIYYGLNTQKAQKSFDSIMSNSTLIISLLGLIIIKKSS